LRELFEQSYRELQVGAELPEVEVKFFRFTTLKNTIRLRQGRLRVRVSDLLSEAPQPVLRALANILLAKLYRRPIDPSWATRYRRHLLTRPMSRKAHLARRMRGRKQISSARGRIYDLERIFDDLNARFFGGRLRRPKMSWSLRRARRRLGHYDPAHHTIVISRAFDHPTVPCFVVEYIVYHEMLHIKHPIASTDGRRCVHSQDFQAEERLFAPLEDAKRFLREL
jgi:predicted metal-dependent hydrolase